MTAVIEVFGVDGALQSVSLHAQVRADEVVNAIARRRGTPPELVSFFTLYQVVVWKEALAPLEAAFFNADAVKTQVVLKKLAPDDRPLKVRAQSEARVKELSKSKEEAALAQKMQISLQTYITFAYLDAKGESVFKEHGEEIITQGHQRRSMKNKGGFTATSERLTPTSFSSTLRPNMDHRGAGAGNDPRNGGAHMNQSARFAPINWVGRGDKCGYLLQRSAVNPREWQRRWCVLRKSELVHALSNVGFEDAQIITLTNNRIKAIPASDLGGMKHCFEIDTPHDVLQFRAKTEEEAAGWISAVEEQITLASENENFHLAERMIEDGQCSACTRDESILEKSLESLEGLLSTHAGADRLYRFAKRASLGMKGERNGELVAFYLDLERAHATFSSMPGEAEGRDGSVLESNRLYSSSSINSVRYYQSSMSSLASSSGSSITGATLRGSAAVLSRKEWMVQICDRFIALFEAKERIQNDDQQSDVESQAVLRAAEKLRAELEDEDLQFIPKESCLVVIEEARQVVKHSIELGLYSEFLASEDYERIIASIPSRIFRSR